jgi:Ca2+-dependent lipid-binding protein
VLTLKLKYNNNLKGGLLDVRIEKATLTRDTELVGKMDPYVEIKLGSRKVRTSVKEEAGKTPVWM